MKRIRFCHLKYLLVQVEKCGGSVKNAVQNGKALFLIERVIMVIQVVDVLNAQKN